MDENILSGILKRIEEIKEELNELESKVKQLETSPEEPVTKEATAADLSSDEPIDLAISIPDISAAAYKNTKESNATEDLPDVSEEAHIASQDVSEEVPEDLPDISDEAPEAAPVKEQKTKDSVPNVAEEAAKPETNPLEAEKTPEAEPKPAEKKHRKKKTVLESEKAGTAVMDVMEHKEAWRTDRPGYPVKNIISAISLNDRLLLINALFKEDPVLFQDTIAKFNGMASLQEAIEYIEANFNDWNLNSEPVYRLMMAVRRKLQ
jgi:hypothetical protein